MKLKLKEILQISRGITPLYESDLLDPSVSWDVLKIVKIVRKEVDDFNEIHKKIIERNGVDQKKMESEIMPVLDKEIDLEISKIKWDHICEVKMSAKNIEMIERIIEK